MTRINLYSKLKLDPSYKLIQLTPDLLKVIEQSANDTMNQEKNGNDSDSDNTNHTGLAFKAIDMKDNQTNKNDVVLCSSNKTWLLRQKNHSNTVLLMEGYEQGKVTLLPEKLLFGKKEQPTLNLLGFSKTTYEYETKPIQGKINLDLIPIFGGELNFGEDFICQEKGKDNDDDGDGDGSNHYLKSFDELVENSACSREECLREWHRLGGCRINGYMCIFSEAFMTKALHITLVSILGGSIDMNKLDLKETFKLVTRDIDEDYNPYTLEVIRTVLNKFGTKRLKDASNDEKMADCDDSDRICWKLNMDIIAKWYGKQALLKYASQHSVPIDEFLIKWRSLFPPFFPCDIDIDMLRGMIYKPDINTIQYISRDILPMEPKERFKLLFKLQNSWLLEDIAPYIEELNVRGLKLDNFIMKYARRKRVASPNNKNKSQIIISSR